MLLIQAKNLPFISKDTSSKELYPSKYETIWKTFWILFDANRLIINPVHSGLMPTTIRMDPS